MRKEVRFQKPDIRGEGGSYKLRVTWSDGEEERSPRYVAPLPAGQAEVGEKKIKYKRLFGK